MKRILILSAFTLLATVCCMAGHQGIGAVRAFVENNGQMRTATGEVNSEVVYSTMSTGLNVQLRKSGFSYDCSQSQPDRSESLIERIDVDFINANPAVKINASNDQRALVHDYRSGVAKGTHSKCYSVVTYEGVYPGIDVRFSITDQKQVEYDIIVHPNGDLNNVKFRVQGPRSVEWDNGLVFGLTNGSVKETLPSVYIKETGEKIELTATLDHDILSFAAQIPDHQTLIIDPVPVLIWGTYYGGSEMELAEDVVYDVATGDVYMVGWTHSSTNIATSGAHQSTKSDTSDAYLARFDSTGQLIWATYYGGTLDDIFAGVCIDNGAIYTTGFSYSPSGIATPGTHQTVLNGLHDIIVARFTTDGVLDWCTYYGSSGSEEGVGVAITPSGKLIVAGITTSDSLGTIGSFGGTADNIVAEFTTDGQQLNWAAYLGGQGYEEAIDLAVMPGSGDIMLCGITGSQNGIASTTAWQNTFGGINDGFLARFNPNGTIKWSTYVGGVDYEWMNGLAIGPDEETYIVGYTESQQAIASGGTAQANYGGGGDGFLMRFNIDGVRAWGTYVGGRELDAAFECAVFQDECIVVGETSTQNDFYYNAPFGFQLRGLSDGFIRQYSSTDGLSEWSAYVGGSSTDRCTDIVTDNSDAYIVIGETNSEDFIATSGSHQEQYGGNQDAFIMRFGACITPQPEIKIDGSRCVDRNGSVYSTLYVPGNTYQWSFPSEAIILDGQDSNVVTVLWTVEGDYTFSVLETAPPGCDAKGSLSTRIFPELRPSAQSIDGRLEACEGDTIFLKAQDGLFNYHWTTGDSTQILAVTKSGFYQVFASDTMCEGLSDSVSVDIWPLPASDITGPTSICLNGTTTVDYTVTQSPAAQYLWTAPILGTAMGSISEPTLTVRWDTPGTDTLYVEIFGDHGCENIGFIEVVIGDSLKPNIASSDGVFEFCEGDDLMLIADPGYTTYLWSTGDTTQTIVITQEGTYFVEVSDDQCSGTSDPVVVTIVPAPSPTISGNNAVCRTEQDTAVYSVQSTAGSEYLWLQPSLGFIDGPDDANQVSIVWNAAGIDTVRVEELNATGCVGESELVVVVSEGTLVTISEDNGDLVADIINADEYRWLNEALQPISGASTQRYRPTAGGIYYVEVRVGGCWSRSAAYNYNGLSQTEMFSVSDVDFGSLPINVIVNASGGHVNEIIVVNLSPQDIALDSAALIGTGFDVPNQFPRLLKPGDTSRITVRFLPTEEREYVATVVIYFGSETGFSRMRGVGRQLAPDERITEVVLQPDRVEVAPGEQFDVILSIGTESPTITTAQQYEATMQWDARVLELISSPEVFFRTTGREDNYYTAKVPEGQRAPGQTQLIRIPFRAKLGEIDSTVLVFSGAIAFRWKDDTKAFPACRDSVVHVKICDDGGRRLITKRTFAQIVGIAPHPVDDRTNIFVDASGTMHCEVEIIDALGTVARHTDLGTVNGGRSSMSVDMSGLQSGPYIVRLNYGDGTTSRLVIRR